METHNQNYNVVKAGCHDGIEYAIHNNYPSGVEPDPDDHRYVCTIYYTDTYWDNISGNDLDELENRVCVEIEDCLRMVGEPYEW